jgi:hypothetical protein
VHQQVLRTIDVRGPRQANLGSATALDEIERWVRSEATTRAGNARHSSGGIRWPSWC